MPEQFTLFPTASSTNEVINSVASRLPITDKNELIAVMRTYHNAILSEQTEDKKLH
jgi:hypothetical protein